MIRFQAGRSQLMDSAPPSRPGPRRSPPFPMRRSSTRWAIRSAARSSAPTPERPYSTCAGSLWTPGPPTASPQASTKRSRRCGGRPMSEAAEAPATEWEFEVVRRVRAGEDEEVALTAVRQEFLGAGDPRPLIDMGRARRPLPALARRYIAQMFDESPQSNEPSPTYFDVQCRYRTVTDEARRRREWIEAGKAVLDNNQDPDWMFWLVL